MNPQEKYFLNKISFYQEIILGMTNIMSMYVDKVVEENVEAFVDGNLTGDEYQIPQAIGAMLYIVQSDMNEFVVTYKDIINSKEIKNEQSGSVE